MESKSPLCFHRPTHPTETTLAVLFIYDSYSVPIYRPLEQSFFYLAFPQTSFRVRSSRIHFRGLSARGLCGKSHPIHATEVALVAILNILPAVAAIRTAAIHKVLAVRFEQNGGKPRWFASSVFLPRTTANVVC